MICVAICDDEPYVSDKLTKLVHEFFRAKGTNVEIRNFFCGEELLNYKGQTDVIFLDIQMKNIDGMKTAKKLRAAGFKGFLIFVTILKELVFEAFEVQAFDYLLKPIEKPRFEKTMDRLMESMRHTGERKLFIHVGNENRIIFFDEIVYCEVIDRKIYLHLESSETVDYYERFEKLEKELDKCFFKCHRSYLINLKYLRSFKSGMAYMSNGESIPVSRSRKKELSNEVLQYMSEWR